MELQQPKKSTVSVKSVKLTQLNFIQKNNLINMEGIGIDLGFNASYNKLEDNNTIQFNLGIQLKLFQEDDNKNKIDIGIMQFHLAGIFYFEYNIDKALFRNLISILYSYLRPIAAQISVMAKLPPLDLPILNFAEINIDDIEEE
ncbi:hypothetical protein [Brachyspira pilosicoli]|uniref:hypothetical protein n=1 Tax=Brachyspira pilosicoli TaxID=52584 RepID=UPI001CA5E4F7|nr:hypothetical protein [Brachyspira pilosicoli]MBW5381891.1 hypothetical protein [Brachyspira pilosicoli]